MPLWHKSSCIIDIRSLDMMSQHDSTVQCEERHEPALRGRVVASLVGFRPLFVPSEASKWLYTFLRDSAIDWRAFLAPHTRTSTFANRLGSSQAGFDTAKCHQSRNIDQISPLAVGSGRTKAFGDYRPELLECFFCWKGRNSFAALQLLVVCISSISVYTRAADGLSWNVGNFQQSLSKSTIQDQVHVLRSK